MNGTHYLVDNNALIALGRRRIRTTFFRTHCRVTADVLREAAEHPDRALLETTAVELTPLVLEEIRAVMSGLGVGDTRLVDLYANKGTADPGMIATVRAARAVEESMLFPDTWVIVTNDRAVETTATEHDVQTMKPADLAELIDAAGAGETRAAGGY
ncbi:hypothetical protein [Nocardioides sp.]|uniref:hypothetical protein n=1 Tax=Nocardioides sp. TaxID=35761 RepID=UPI0025E4B7C9|nr:hypothetical protein [Nocardioides sp.]